jgi:hypothetical protein
VGWYVDVPIAHAAPVESHIEVPAPLLAFYDAVAGRPDLLGTHNRILAPRDLALHEPDGMVEFGTENQGSVWWLFDPAKPDPPVYLCGMEDGPTLEGEPLSGFLLLFALREAHLAAPYGGWAFADEAQTRRLTQGLAQVPLRPLVWPSDPTQLLVGPGLIAEVGRAGDDEFEVYVGSRHRAALRPLRNLGLRWQSFNG